MNTYFKMKNTGIVILILHILMVYTKHIESMFSLFCSQTFDVELIRVSAGGATLGGDTTVRLGILKSDSPNGVFSFVAVDVSNVSKIFLNLNNKYYLIFLYFLYLWSLSMLSLRKMFLLITYDRVK